MAFGCIGRIQRYRFQVKRKKKRAKMPSIMYGYVGENPMSSALVMVAAVA
jgi:hypothetical protein